jgi:hypothetical protein
MKKLLTFALFVAAALGVSQLSGTTVHAATPSNDSYHYTAQPGDSYSLMARKAVQTYGIKTNTKLSPAQILFAENGLSADAGNIELNLGQTVDIKKSTVGSWIEKAKKLSTEQKALWAEFVPFVDFNTNNVGEKR